MTRTQRGFTLIEFMIAATISLIILAALTGAFVANSRTRDEMERANQQIENGRYALQVMTDDLQMAGFYAQFDINLANPPTPAIKPHACTTLLADLRSALPLHIQGYDNGGGPLCLVDYKAGTDVLVVRRVSTCVSGSANCAAVAGAPYFQASTCSSGAELQSSQATDFYRLDSTIGNLDRHLRDCTTLAPLRQFLVHIYYVANNDQAGDGIPTLKRLELGGSGGAPAFSIVPIADGIENLQLEYGIDTDGDGQPDVYTADPDNYTAAGGNCPTVTADCMTNWRNVMAVKVNLLARNTTPSLNFIDSKTYVLGLDASGAPNSFGPFNDAYKRHAYTTSVRLTNPAGRRET